MTKNFCIYFTYLVQMWTSYHRRITEQKINIEKILLTNHRSYSNVTNWSHIAFSRHVSLVSSNLRVPQSFLVFHDPGTFEECWLGILKNVSHFVFVWCFLTITFRFGIFGRITIEVVSCSSQYIMAGDTGAWYASLWMIHTDDTLRPISSVCLHDALRQVQHTQTQSFPFDRLDVDNQDDPESYSWKKLFLQPGSTNDCMKQNPFQL